jgi:hypothetical protein
LKALAARPPALPPEEVSESALRMITLLAPPTAAVVLGRVGDVLAWNEPARILFPGRLPAPHEHPGRLLAPGVRPARLPAPGVRPARLSASDAQLDRRPNNARYVFCDPRARELFADWSHVADDTVAHLRAAAGHLVDDPDYRALVDELLATSPEFATRWPRRDVKRHVSGHKRFHHPTLGDLTLPYEVLAVLDAPDQYLVVYGLTTERNLVGDVEIPGSVSTS